MLVALGIGSLVTVGVVELLAANQQTHAALTGAARLQESGRHALEFIARSARASGYLGCAPGDLRNTLNGPVDGLFEVDVAEGLEAFDGSGSASVPGNWTPALDGLPRRAGRRSVNAFGSRNGIDVATIPPLSDVLVLRFVEAPRALAARASPGDAPVVDHRGRGRLAPDAFAVIADCERAALFRVSDVEQSGDRATLRRHSGSGDYANASGVTLVPPEAWFGGEAGPAGTTVGRVVTHVYYVAPGAGVNNRGAPILSLWRKSGTSRPAELVQGIEDLQVRLGLDTDGDGAPNRYAPSTAGAAATVRALRIAVTANSVDAVAGDRPLRRTFVQTVAVRNG